MSNELQEIKNLILGNRDLIAQNTKHITDFKSEVKQQFNSIDEKFDGIAQLFENQNEYIDNRFEVQKTYIDGQIKEVGKENQRHLEILIEHHKQEIQTVGEQYKSLYNKVKEHDEILSPLSR